MYRFYSRLSVRIFALFSLYCLVIVFIATILPSLDQARIRPVTENEKEKIVQRFARELNFILIQNKNIRNHRGFIIIPMSDNHQEFSQAIERVSNPHYRNFITTVFDEKELQQQSIDSQLIIGPFSSRQLNSKLFMVISNPPQSYYVSKILNSPLILFAIMMCASLPFIFILTYSLYRPIQRLKKGSDRVAQGDWEIDRSLEKGAMEFRSLGESFNKMVEALQQAEAEKNRLFANMSHELRTPLTRIRLTNSMLRRKASNDLTPEIDRIETNLILVEDRIKAMLSLSKALILNRESHQITSLKDALIDLLNEASFEAEANNKVLIYDEIPSVELSLNVPSFQSGLENILRNAIRYSRQETRILFNVNHETLTIVVQDDGIGVDPSEIGRLFEAFFRAENSHSVDSNGAGLGLAIADHMVKSHKGTIIAENNADVSQSSDDTVQDFQGLKITITLPIVSSFESKEK